MSKILIVDDDKEIASLIGDSLYDEGYETLLAYDGEVALEKVSNNLDLEMIILDIMMPKVDGLEVCRKIREKVSCPIIFVSAKSRTLDTVLGLEIGADDYITKPFNPSELVARVKSQIRRYTMLGSIEKEKDEIIIEGLCVNVRKKTVTVDGEDVRLTPIEFKILELFAKNRGKVFSTEDVYRNVWNEDNVVYDNTIAVHIRHIREKIEINPKEPKYIKVVWGIGYKID